MGNKFETNLKALGLSLPKPAPSAGLYVPYKIVGQFVFISGQLPFRPDGNLITGCLGKDVDISLGQEAARLCIMGCLAQLKEACGGDFAYVRQCIEIGGFVRCEADFSDQPSVINGASELLLKVFEEQGKHARFAVGASALPLHAAVEIKAMFEIQPRSF